MITLDLKQLKGRKLDKNYPVWHFVEYDFPYKRNDVVFIRKIVVIFAFTTFGKRRIIDIVLDKPEDNRFWLEKFEELKNRGCNNITFMSTSLGRNIEKASRIVYNSSILVPAAANIMKDICKYFRDDYTEKLITEFKNLFFLDDVTKFDSSVELIREKHLDFSKLLNILLDKNLPLIREFYHYSRPLRVLLYPYFTVRDMKSHIRKSNNINSFFDSVDSFIENNLDWIQTFEKGTIFNKTKWIDVVNDLCELRPELWEVFSNE